MEILITIHDTTSGEETSYVRPGDDFQDFSWTDGNESCDCNRGVYFINSHLNRTEAELTSKLAETYGAVPYDDEGGFVFVCNNTTDNKFKVHIAENKPDGAVLYSEFTPEVDE